MQQQMQRSGVLRASLRHEREMKRRVLENLFYAINKKKITIDNAFDLVKAIFNIVNNFGDMGLEEKKRVVIETLEDIVAGQDGILYTQDDLVSREVLEGLEILISSSFVFATIDLVYELSQAKATARYSCWFSRLFGSICCCWRESTDKQDAVNMPLLQE
jgi:hypothetical protein